MNLNVQVVIMPNKAKSGFIQSESVVKVFEVRTKPNTDSISNPPMKL